MTMAVLAFKWGLVWRLSIYAFHTLVKLDLSNIHEE